MLIRFSVLLLFLSNVLVLVRSQSFLSDWVLSNDTLPYTFFRGFAVYDKVTNCIYGFGGEHTNNNAFIFNVTNSVSTTRHIDTSYFLSNKVSQNAVLIDNTWMYIMNVAGQLLRYNIFWNNITLLVDFNDHIINGSMNSSAIVSNSPENTHLYICKGDDTDADPTMTLCFEWNITTQSGTQISSVCFTLLIVIHLVVVAIVVVLCLYFSFGVFNWTQNVNYFLLIELI